MPSTFTTEQLLLIERLKNKMLKQIILQKLDIDIDDTLDGITDSITDGITLNLASKATKAIEPVQITDECVSTCIIETTNLQTKLPNTSGILLAVPKRESVRKNIDKKKFKAFPDSAEEVNVQNNNSVGDDMRKMVVDNYGAFDYGEIKAELEKLFNDLVSSRAYTNIISSIKTNRMFHLANMNLKEYISQLTTDISRIRAIFTQKEFDTKKINSIVARVLTPLDYRLVFYDGFEKLHIENDQIERLRTTLQNCANYPKCSTPFDDNHFINYFMSFNSIFFDLKFMLETYINNPHGYKSIVYIETKAEDLLGFAYYILHKVDSSKVKYWTLDRRLESLTRDISQNIKQYLVSMFRKIYKSCYGHNKLTDTFKTKYPVLEIDSVVLLNNLFLAVDEPRLNELLRTTIKNTSLYTASTSDRFDKITDDKAQYADFKMLKLSDSDKISLVLSLFDDLDEKRAIAFYNEYK